MKKIFRKSHDSRTAGKESISRTPGKKPGIMNITGKPDRPYYLLLYAGALLSATLWVSFYGSPLPYLVFYTVLLSLPAWFLYVLIIYLTLRIYQGTPDVFCTKGNAVPLEIQLENTGILPMGDLSFGWEERLASYSEIPIHGRFSLNPGEKRKLVGNLRCLYAGTYPAGILYIRVTGLFGIAHFRFRMPVTLRMCVRPVIEESADMEKIREALASDRSKAYREDVVYGNDLRRYIPGDRLNRIHWKASARQGELLSRLPGENEMQEVCLLLMASASPLTFEGIVRRDRFYTYVVSLVWYFVRMRKRIRIWYEKGGWHSTVIDSAPAFDAFYRILADGIYTSNTAPDPQKLREQRGKSLLLTVSEESFSGKQDFSQLHSGPNPCADRSSQWES